MIEDENKVQRYENYKDSGVEWLGEIPEHWELKRFKHIFKEKKITHNIELNSGSISFGKVIYKDDEKIPESTKRSYQVLNKGEFLINPLNLNYDLISLRIALSDKDVVVSSGYIIVQNITNLSKEYYKWLLHIFDVVYMKTLGAGVRQTLSFTHIANSEFAFPPLSEQTSIANFLDDKTEKIDQAISIKEQQIALLKERKQILIHKAVTRGLDDSVPIKDSGVEWIGEIPEHWEVKRLKYIFDKIQTGTTPSTSNQNFYNGNIDWYNPKDLNNEVLIEAERKLSKLAIQKKEIKFFPKDSIVVVGIGATAGKTSYMLNKGTFNQQITGFHSDKEFNKYFFYLLKNLSEVMLNTANYTTLAILNNEFFKVFKLIKPPLSEQKEISSHIESASQKIDTAITLKQREIAKLQEYKRSLINSVVTGKIRVF